MRIRHRVIGLALPIAGLLLACLSVFPGALARGEDRPVKKVRIGLVNTLFRDESEKQIQVIADPFHHRIWKVPGVAAPGLIAGQPFPAPDAR